MIVDTVIRAFCGDHMESAEQIDKIKKKVRKLHATCVTKKCDRMLSAGYFDMIAHTELHIDDEKDSLMQKFSSEDKAFVARDYADRCEFFLENLKVPEGKNWCCSCQSYKHYQLYRDLLIFLETGDKNKLIRNTGSDDSITHIYVARMGLADELPEVIRLNRPCRIIVITSLALIGVIAIVTAFIAILG
jgi:hypothetical protein